MEGMSQDNRRVSPVAAALASALFPGAGYLLLGQRQRALITGGGILLLFVLGFFIAGARVISVPGFDDDGYLKYLEIRHYEGGARVSYTTTPVVAVRPEANRGSYTVTRVNHDGTLESQSGVMDPPEPPRWVLTANPLGAIGDNLSFLGQMFDGPLCAVGGYVSILAARASDPPVARSYSRLIDIGSLYTAVSGMLNLMVIVDSYARAAQARAQRQGGAA
jgi:Family of unknown function (DUF6677)